MFKCIISSYIISDTSGSRLIFSCYFTIKYDNREKMCVYNFRRNLFYYNLNQLKHLTK